MSNRCVPTALLFAGMVTHPSILDAQTTPVPVSPRSPSASAALPRASSAAHAAAIAKYPQLARAGSDIHRAFMARLAAYQSERPSYFQHPDWPLALANVGTAPLPRASSAAHAAAAARYPQLARAGSDFNRAFMARLAAYQSERPSYFQQSDWPLELAHEVAQDSGVEIVAFCNRWFGRKVGDGECATLAVEALKHVNAYLSREDSPAPGDYVWGHLVAHFAGSARGAVGIEKLTTVRPGDIVQFRDAHFDGPVRHRHRGTYRGVYKHHTAVVVEINVAGGMISVLEQNATPT
jgi:hypothetical protein